MANIAEWTSARVMRVEMCCQKAVLMFGPDSHLVEKVREVLEVIPALLIIENLADAKLMVGSTFPLWSPTDVFNVASAVYKTPGVRLDPDSTTSKKGDFATGSPHDLTLPMPSDSAKADEIWCRYEWDECVQEFNLERLVEIAHYDGCEFDMFMIAECRVMLRLRNFPPSPLTVSGIIKLHSDIDDAQRIGELITEGELHLRECGPEKKSLVLGITDLKKIRWFRLTLDGFPLITQSFTDADARRSICGYLHAEPCLLGIHRQLNIHRLPSSWKLLKHLGSGFTSNVYLVDRSSSKFAVKSPRLAFDLQKDIQYLELLRGIDGVPMIQEKIHNMIVLKPLCAHFSVESFFECGTSSLGDLVETLWCSHERGVVNKDLHAKNIMIGESLYDGGKIRFFILDWGFAAHAGVTSNFSGSFVTASDQVLCQLHAIFGQVVVSVNDDLVSLVRCLFLIFNREVNFALHKVKDHPEKIIEFWQQHIEKSPFWRKAQGAALQLQYDGLKELFQMSTRESLIEGCLY